MAGIRRKRLLEVGVLRLRKLPRFAMQLAPLRMTVMGGRRQLRSFAPLDSRGRLSLREPIRRRLCLGLCRGGWTGNCGASPRCGP